MNKKDENRVLAQIVYNEIWGTIHKLIQLYPDISIKWNEQLIINGESIDCRIFEEE